MKCVDAAYRRRLLIHVFTWLLRSSSLLPTLGIRPHFSHIQHTCLSIQMQTFDSHSEDTIRGMNGAVIQTNFPNPSLQVTADHNLKQVEAPVYPPKEGEVLLQVKATGICGYVRVSFSLSSLPLFNFLHGDAWK